MPLDPITPDVDAVIAAGRGAFPELALPDEVAAFVAERIASLPESVRLSRAGDLVLAGACVGGSAAAIQLVRERYLHPVRPSLVKLGVTSGNLTEIEQRVEVALFVATEGSQPGIAQYQGRGALGAYVRAVAIKLALKAVSRGDDARTISDDLLALAPDFDPSPEALLLRHDARAVVKQAFVDAAARLSPQQRLLLRQHYVDGLNIDVLAELYGAHRATTARWIAGARHALLRGMRSALAELHGLTAAELDSLARVVGSQLELSLGRVLTSRSS